MPWVFEFRAKEGWTKYPQREQAFFNMALSQGHYKDLHFLHQTYKDLQLKETSYTIDLETMQQKNRDTGTLHRMRGWGSEHPYTEFTLLLGLAVSAEPEGGAVPPDGTVAAPQAPADEPFSYFTPGANGSQPEMPLGGAGAPGPEQAAQAFWQNCYQPGEALAFW